MNVEKTTYVAADKTLSGASIFVMRKNQIVCTSRVC